MSIEPDVAEEQQPGLRVHLRAQGRRHLVRWRASCAPRSARTADPLAPARRSSRSTAWWRRRPSRREGGAPSACSRPRHRGPPPGAGTVDAVFARRWPWTPLRRSLPKRSRQAGSEPALSVSRGPRGRGEADDRLGVDQAAVGDHGRGRRPGRPSRWSCAAPRCPGPTSAHGLEVGGQEEERVLVAEAGRVVELGQLAPGAPARIPTSSSSSRWAVVSTGSPSTSRLPAGISSRSSVDGGPELAHQEHPAVVEHGHDHDRARVVDDVALERRRPTGSAKVARAGGDQRAR